MEAVNILKIVDLNKTDIPACAWHYLNNFHVTYRDSILKEHLINIGDAIEAIEDSESYLNEHKMKKEIIAVITDIGELCQRHDAGYVRFIEH